MTRHYTLYGTEFSFYTGKARAYLDCKEIDYQEVFSSIGVYKKIIVPNTGVRFIPVLKTPQDEYLQDTAVIIERLESRHPDNPVIPSTPKQKLLSYLFEIWADEWLLIPAMHYRWNKPNFPAIYQAFGKVLVPWAPGFVKTLAGKQLAKRFKGFVPVLGITQNTIPAIEDWFENLVLHQLNEHFHEYDFVLGGRPTLADISLIGPLSAHLFHDPAPRNMLKSKAPHVCTWIERMRQAEQYKGELIMDDVVPETLMVLLKNQFLEFWPVLMQTQQTLLDWKASHRDKKVLPRSVGKHKFAIAGVEGERSVLSFHQWKLQRVMQAFNHLDVEQKLLLHNWLHELGGADYFKQGIRNLVTRENNRLLMI